MYIHIYTIIYIYVYIYIFTYIYLYIIYVYLPSLWSAQLFVGKVRRVIPSDNLFEFFLFITFLSKPKHIIPKTHCLLPLWILTPCVYVCVCSERAEHLRPAGETWAPSGIHTCSSHGGRITFFVFFPTNLF